MGKGSKQSSYRFDQFILDSDKLMLYRDGESVTLPPKVVKTLAVLVENRGTILSKDDLLEQVWEDSIVEESNLSQNLYLLRKTLGTSPVGPPYIETLRRRGYRFNASVEVLPEPPVQSVDKPDPPAPTPPSVGVMREGNVLRLVDWRPEAPLPAPVEDDPPAPVRRVSSRLALFLAIPIILIAGGVVLIWPKLMPAAINAESEREISVVRLTDGATPFGAAISPDGNVLVYHENEGDVIRMFAQQTGQASRVELLSTTDQVLGAKSFTPDGQFIFYYAHNRSGGDGFVYRIPVMGGPSVKVLDAAYGAVSFSPDGKEMAFLRYGDGRSETSVVIAGQDGRGERVLISRKSPKSIGQPAWSPDGKLIAFAEMDIGTGRPTGRCRLYVAEVATAKVTAVSEEKWDNILQVEWFYDGKGLALLGTRENEGYSTRRDQVFYISYPAGVSRRVTTEGHRHEPESLGVTKSGAVLAISANRSSQLWTISADGNASTAQQMTKGIADGRAGLGPLPDGKIGYLSRVADDINIMVSDATGSNTKQLATGFPFVEELRADPLGRYFVFSTVKDHKNQLFRINTDGTGVKQLTTVDGGVVDSSISPDGNWIVFDSSTYGERGEIKSLFRIPSGGGQPLPLGPKGCAIPTYSSDGSMISCIRMDAPEIAILSATDGAELERHPRPVFATWNFGIGWTPDGAGLVYIVTEKKASNVWIQPRDGSKPKPLTNFSSGTIFRYAFSPDGSKLYLARGYPTQDALLIRNIK